MGGVAAVAGALGPTIGGVLTSVFSWRAVLLVNVPLLIITLILTLRSVQADPRQTESRRRTSISRVRCCSVRRWWGWCLGSRPPRTTASSSPSVLAPIVVAVITAILFVRRERRATDPLMSFRLLRRHPNYLAATVSQGLAGMAEMGLSG